MKNLKKFESSKLEKSQFHPLKGGAARKVVIVIGITRNTFSQCHSDGCYEGDNITI